MSDVLAGVYSRSDAFKRKLIDALRNPGATVDQLKGRMVDDLRSAREQIGAAADEGVNYGPASRALATKMAEGYNPVGMTKVVGPQSEALEIARQNGVKMLGLPEGNTAMDRAKALGFDTDAFHGTNREFSAFSNDMLGAKTGAKSAQKAHFFASKPEMSNTYVSTEHVYPMPHKSGPPVYEKLLKNKAAWEEFNEAPDAAGRWAVLEKYGMNYGSGQVMPVMLRMGNTKAKDYQGLGYRDQTYNDVLTSAKRGKKDSVVFQNTYDPGPHQGYSVQGDVYAVFDPARVRSRFAAFDPDRVNENDLLAGMLPLGAIALPASNENKGNKQMRPEDIIDALRKKKD